MLEDTFSERDIWDYKSKRKAKAKAVHTNNCSPDSPKPVEKRAVEATEEVKDSRMCLGETDSHISVVSSQDYSCEDGTQQSQGKETTPRKCRRTSKNKQVTPKMRLVYNGFCPNCQLPFSSLLGQTPRWHVFECLDSPPVSGTECPDGLLCTSTIPSHYKRYTHFLLAQSRASNSPPSSPFHGPGGGFAETNSGFLCSLGERWPPHQRETKNLKNVSVDPLLVEQCLKILQSPAETMRKISCPTNTQMSQPGPKFAQCLKKEKLEGVGLPLAEELDSQNTSERVHLPLPEHDVSDQEISYSPLQSDEETYNMDEKLNDSQPGLFSKGSTKDGSLEEDDNSCSLFENTHYPFLRDQEESVSEVSSILTQDRYNEELYKYKTLKNSSQLFQNEGVILCHDPACTDDFLLFPPALAGGLAFSYQATETKPDEQEFHSPPSSKQKQIIEEPAVCNKNSLPLLKGKMSKPLKSQGGRCPSFHPTQSNRELSSKDFSAKNNTNSARFCRKALGRMLKSQAALLNTETLSSTPAAGEALKMLPSGSQSNATSPLTKAMKQMDIGVYFGLPPKRQEKLVEGSAIEGMNPKPVASPNKKRAGQCKRKAEKSLSDLDVDAKNLNENWQSGELSSKRAQHQRKRFKKSDSLPEGTQQKRSDYVIKIKADADALSQNQVSIKSACGRLRRGNMKIPQLSDAGELRKRKCPFYKKIPGTGFTVDAFQYGSVEGCTAYFLTHFHADHYAGLSKNFRFPVYCSEITANLLKRKLHVEEQYIHPLPMDTECMVNGIKVVFLDANHCPGAIMILFYPPNGDVILHTGDFRADPTMERSLLAGQKVHTLYLDTTYCSPEYCFPSQQEVIQFAINTAFEAVTQNPRTLVVCGTYSIGKEKVFLAIAEVLGSKLGMSREKYKTLQCLKIPEIDSFITTDMYSSLVHLLPMMQINFKSLQSHLKMFGGKYDQILAFRPTGWTHSNKLTSIMDIVPQTKGNISIYGIPYSEHSSYLEMKRFVQWLKPQKIIPTVNVGNFKSRSTMEKYFKEWKLEAGY